MSEALKAVGLPVVMIEYDAHANFNPAGSIYGLLTEFLGKARIDLLVVSGRRWCDDLRRLGPEVLYLPKAAPASFLTRGNHGSGAFCAFGSVAHGQYAERAALFNAIRPTISIDVAQTGLDRTLATLRAAITARHDGPVVHRLRFPYPDMATLLAWYSGCIICDRGLGEPMIKHFESAALGVAPVRDDEAEGELEALGYRDEESMVVYRSRQDLFDKLAHYHRHRSDLERIQAGARAVSGRHTWEERARTFHHALAARF